MFGRLKITLPLARSTRLMCIVTCIIGPRCSGCGFLGKRKIVAEDLAPDAQGVALSPRFLRPASQRGFPLHLLKRLPRLGYELRCHLVGYGRSEAGRIG